MIEPYEKKKVEFTDRLNKEIMQDLQEFEMKKEKKREVQEVKSILDIGTTKQREAKRLYVKYEGNLDKIAEELQISERGVRLRLQGSEGLADMHDYLTEKHLIGGN